MMGPRGETSSAAGARAGSPALALLALLLLAAACGEDDLDFPGSVPDATNTPGVTSTPGPTSTPTRTPTTNGGLT